MWFKTKLFLVVLGLSFVLSQVSLAEEAKEAEEAKAFDLGQVVVTATRTEKFVSEAPGSVEVVTKEEMEKKDIKTADEALNNLSGVFSKRSKGLMDTLARVTLRGIPSQDRTLILMDGLTLNEPYSGAVRWGRIQPEDLERIEVVKGPFSSLYGGNAMGGVVNIITKMPEKREFIFKGGYGSDRLYKGYLSYGDKFKERLALLLSYGYKSTDGYRSALVVTSKTPTAGITGWEETTSPTGEIRYLIGDKGNNTWWDELINFKIGYDFSETSKLNLSLLRAREEYKYDDPHTYLKDAQGNEVWSYTKVAEKKFLSGSGGAEQYNYTASFETLLGDIKTKFNLGLLDVQEKWYISPQKGATRSGGPGKVTEYPLRGYNTELQFSLPMFNRHILTFGGALRAGEVDLKEYNLTNWRDRKSKTNLRYEVKGKDRAFALFLQDEIEVLDNLTAYLGLRGDFWKTYDGYVNEVGESGYPKDYPSRSKSSLSPKLALVYKPLERTILRSSIGKAFRPPNLYELYRTWTWWGKTYAGNPDLQPETTLSWDLGLEQGLWKGARLKTTYFENYLEDLIYTKKVTPTYYEKINVGEAESRGIEIEVEQRLKDWLRVFANFTHTDSEIKENLAKPETVGKKLTHTPERMSNFGIELGRDRFLASLVARYVSKQYRYDDNSDTADGVYGVYDSYLVTDAKLSYKLTDWVTISFSVDNLFDEEYFVYYKAQGRKWFTEVSLRF